MRIQLGISLNADDFVFIRPDGSPINPNAITLAFRRIIKRAGLKNIRIHDLRHTYATLQRNAGQPIEAISRVLGHASALVTLKIYDHWEGDFRAPADTMDQMLEKASKNNNEGAFVRRGGGS